MLGFLLAAAATAGSANPAALPDPGDDPDFRCMVAISIALDQMTSDDNTVKDERASVIPVFTYYYGRVSARYRKVDFSKDVAALVDAPGYGETRLRPDLARCGQEAAQLGHALDQLGEVLQNQASRNPAPADGNKPG